MKISKKEAKREDWDKVKSWNYKLKKLKSYNSVVVAELEGPMVKFQQRTLKEYIISLKVLGNLIFVEKLLK